MNLYLTLGGNDDVVDYFKQCGIVPLFKLEGVEDFLVQEYLSDLVCFAGVAFAAGGKLAPPILVTHVFTALGSAVVAPATLTAHNPVGQGRCTQAWCKGQVTCLSAAFNFCLNCIE